MIIPPKNIAVSVDCPFPCPELKGVGAVTLCIPRYRISDGVFGDIIHDSAPCMRGKRSNVVTVKITVSIYKLGFVVSPEGLEPVEKEMVVGVIGRYLEIIFVVACGDDVSGLIKTQGSHCHVHCSP
ncbi:hypothetical protein MNBD_NITROSPIRAE03-1747 [hydrothermal vent metagenome]|uniref:Uncharacterized protein n=1 Tax=hydrothermal vent metagenome TaxID=652676 RepID=A0A3B1DYV1_9ZZZZ